MKLGPFSLRNRWIAAGKVPVCMVILFSACFASHELPENQDGSARSQNPPGASNAADGSNRTGIAGQYGAVSGLPGAGAGTGSGGAAGAVGPVGGDPVCGNRRVESGEQCDGPNLDGFDCVRLGFEGGALRCHPTACVFDVSGCGAGPRCGNGVIEDGESCEGTDLDGASCESLGFGGGDLRCNPARCVFDFSNCRRPVCGNGLVEGEEQCDGDELDGMNCLGLGYQGGTLYCDSATCTFDVSQCFYQICGRGYCGRS
jgi:hypothetical protein